MFLLEFDMLSCDSSTSIEITVRKKAMLDIRIIGIYYNYSHRILL